MTMLKRGWTYLQERFPLGSRGILVAALSSGGLSFSSMARQAAAPTIWAYGAAALSCLLFFLQLRILDEFKDYREDCQFRPYRPVPRGLVSLRELGWVGVGAMGVQLLLALSLSFSLLPWLLLVWGYGGLMGKEFWLGRWLKGQPVVYLLSHMAIMPLIMGYATACDWQVAGETPPRALGWLLGVSFLNGLSIEIGRKIRASTAEEVGVETYSRLWGLGRSIGVWGVTLLGTGGLAIAAGLALGWSFELGLGIIGWGLVGLLICGGAIASGMTWIVRNRPDQISKLINGVTAVWTLGLYLLLGIVPLGWASLG